MPMQPSPMAETSRSLFPSLRFCISVPPSVNYWPSSRLSSQSKFDLLLAISHRPFSRTYSSW